MIGSRATKHKPRTYWDRDRRTASGSAFWWQVHISFSVNSRQTMTCSPDCRMGPLFTHLPDWGLCFKGSLRQWHKKIYTREVCQLFFPQCDKLRSLTAPTEGNISHLKHITKQRTTKCFWSHRGKYKLLLLHSTGKTSGKTKISLYQSTDTA